MTHARGTDHLGRLYVIVCGHCGTDHRPALTARTASDARLLARREGWRAHNAPRRRRRQPDLCPDCRQETAR